MDKDILNCLKEMRGYLSLITNDRMLCFGRSLDNIHRKLCQIELNTRDKRKKDCDKVAFAIKLFEEAPSSIKLPLVRDVYIKDGEVWVNIQIPGNIAAFPITEFFPDFEELFAQFKGYG